ncbi:MAG TPA: hypothetical protein VK775_22485 [Chthoniobacterales bacterium]|jgi:hypothetical protein|nr:hypothetical protein [Chthoniobacterales bacterium]
MNRFVMMVSMEMYHIRMKDFSFDGLTEDEMFTKTIACPYCSPISHASPRKLEELISASHNPRQFLEMVQAWNFHECRKQLVERWE